MVRIRSSTTWYVATVGFWVEKEDIRRVRALRPDSRQEGRCHPWGQMSRSPGSLQRTGLQRSCLQTLEESFQLLGQAAPEASEVLLGTPTQHPIKMAL